MTDKVKSQHTRRRAILYVRQSSAYQVLNNQESRRLQYAMRDRLESLGWRQIEVIDEDLGQTASGAAVRSGFERMVADVCMGEVGAVAARELSRFARNSREWQQLIEVCRVVDTVLVDNEQVYSPRAGNDRLLLGLKGSLSEYELDVLRQRSLEARYAKARRGELLVAVPVGFIKSDDQKYEMDPNRQVQDRIRLVFSKFFELGSVRQTLLWFLEQDLKMPTRNAEGDLSWKIPRYSTLYNVLDNPAYAGAYAYGRTEHGSRYEQGEMRKVSRRRPRSEWQTLILEHHEGYVTWRQHEQIRAMIDGNVRGLNSPGAARKGPALLSGLLRCGRCGRKLTVAYSGAKNRRFVRYNCVRGHLDNGDPKCIAFGGTLVDAMMSREILRVVQPASLEVSVAAMQELHKRGDAVLAALQSDLEAAEYAASRAQRQFDAADPENRLVAGELERRWNDALREVQQARQRIADHAVSQSSEPALAVEDAATLAEDLESLWSSDRCDERLKKRILRTLIHEIVVDLDEAAGEIKLTVHWQGGVHTELTVPRRKRGSTVSTSPDIIEAVRTLALVSSDDVIAGVLNRNGLRTGRGNRFSRERVTSLRCKHGIPVHNSDRKHQEGWLNLTDAADYLGVNPKTLRLAAERGVICSRHPLADGPWIFNRNDLDSEAAQELSRRAKLRKGAAIPDPRQQNLDF